MSSLPSTNNRLTGPERSLVGHALTPASTPASATRLAGRVVSSRARQRLAFAGATSGVVLLFLLSVLAADAVMQQVREDVRLTGSMLVLAIMLVALLGTGALVREIFFWRASCRAMAKLVNELRAGEAPLAELDELIGGARVLVEPLRAVLLDLREQKRANVELNEEIRKRILNRTDALERQLGTLKAQASRDAMTGLNNRRAFDAMLPQIFHACRGGREDLCALMVDVDNFKPLNDTLGHAAGDELLKSIGEIVRSSIREHDVAFRVGGDEFAILLPRASAEIGRRLAERLTSLVEHLARPLRLPHPPGLSIGVAALSEEPRPADAKELMAAADRRLYALKQAKPGRHQRSVA